MKKQVEESYLDYRKYHMTSKEYLIYGIQYLLLICLSAYVFYPFATLYDHLVEAKKEAAMRTERRAASDRIQGNNYDSFFRT